MEEFDAPRRKPKTLPAHVLAGIKQGQEDIKAGDVITFDEFKGQLSYTSSLIAKKAANDASFAEYSKQLDESASEATKNGLTQEILQKLLASDD